MKIDGFNAVARSRTGTYHLVAASNAGVAHCSHNGRGLVARFAAPADVAQAHPRFFCQRCFSAAKIEGVKAAAAQAVAVASAPVVLHDAHVKAYVASGRWA